jgi:hypothetical protein
MDLYSDNWFKYLREGLVTEGLLTTDVFASG